MIKKSYKGIKFFGLSLFILSFLITGVNQISSAPIGSGIGLNDINITKDPRPSPPPEIAVWMCDNREVYESMPQIGHPPEYLYTRMNNYAFEGETIFWSILVYDENGTNNLKDVYVSLTHNQGEGLPEGRRVSCIKDETRGNLGVVERSCNARLVEEEIEAFDPEIMSYYNCYYETEVQNPIYGEYWVTNVAEDIDGGIANMDENEYWFFNPNFGVETTNGTDQDGNIVFPLAYEGSYVYSNPIKIMGSGDESSGVMQYMFITKEFEGLEIYYYAENGNYNTTIDPRADAEGYVPLNAHGKIFDESFYDESEMFQIEPMFYIQNWFMHNFLYVSYTHPEIMLKFKVKIPENAERNYTGNINIWGNIPQRLQSSLLTTPLKINTIDNCKSSPRRPGSYMCYYPVPADEEIISIIANVTIISL